MGITPFILKHLKAAENAAKTTGVPALFALAQSGLETGWGKHSPGNMMFGIKVGAGKNYGGWTGTTQYLWTTEYHSSPDVHYDNIAPSYPQYVGNGKWKYRIQDDFRSYPTSEHSFRDWGGLLSQNPRYRNAFSFTQNPFRFTDEIAKAGYATDPEYADKIKRLMLQISEIAQSQSLWKNKWVWIVSAASVALVLGVVVVGTLTQNDL